MLKLCYVDVSGKTGKFLFPNINKDMFNDILNYKSWTLNNESGMSGCFFDSWSNNASEKISYMNAVDTRNGVLVETKYGRGFIPVLVKHLEKLGFTLLENGKSFNMYSRCTIVKYPMFKIVLRNYQLNCCLKWQRDGIGAVKSPTGSGKTYIASNLMKNIGYKGLILVHTIDLVKQWENSLINSFGLTFKGNIGIFGGGKKLDDVKNKSVVIGTYQTAIKESKSGISNISILDKMGFGMIIADEVHHVAADTFKEVLNGLFIPHKLGLSATPRRLDNKEPEIFALVDNIKASVSIHGLIKDGYVVRPDFYNIYYIDNEILREVDKEKKGLAKSRKLKQLSAFSVRKYELLLKLIERLRRENKTFLLFTDFVKAAEVVEELLEKFICVNDKKFKVIRVAQEMSSEERSAIFNNVGIKYNQYNGLIFAKLGSEGIDISAVDCIINLSPSKSPVTFAQRTGRALRPLRNKTHAEIYQFVLRGSMEEGWNDVSFDEFRQEDFVAKNYVIR